MPNDQNAFDLPKSPIIRYYQGLRKQKAQQGTKVMIDKKHTSPTVSTILKNKVDTIISHQLIYLKNEIRAKRYKQSAYQYVDKSLLR